MRPSRASRDFLLRLVPFVFCVVAMASVRALACANSMGSYDDPDPVPVLRPVSWLIHTSWIDAILWPVGAVFLNRFVLVNIWAPTAVQQLKLSSFTRFFFGLVGSCLVLLLSLVSAVAPMFYVDPQDLARCSVDNSLLLILVAFPAALFLLQAVLFHWPAKRWFGQRTRIALASMVFTSVLLAIGVGRARDERILPRLCGSSWGVSFERAPIHPSAS